MRMTPALVVTTLAASTASLAVPVMSLPGRGPHAVRTEVVDLAFARTDLTDRQLPKSAGGVAQRLLTPAAYPKKSFSMVGLTWDVASAPDPVTGAEMPFELSIRTRQAGKWTSWEHLHAEGDAPDSTDAADAGGASRAGTAPAWVGPSDALQVRLDRFRGKVPTGLRAMVIDPGRSSADADVGRPQVMSQAHAAIAWPTIHRRREWGANEKLRSSAPRYNVTIKGGFLHHTAGSNNYSPADVPKMIRGVYAYHTRGRGWSDIGYNFVVDKFGRIWEGRAGGVEKAVLGAHTGGFNRNTFGVSALGNFEHTHPSPAMIAAIARIFAWKFAMYGNEPGLDALSKIRLISEGGGTSRFRAGKAATFLRISGHRDAGRTACPGRYLYAQLPTVRTLVMTILNTQSTHGPAFPLPIPGAPGPGETAPVPAGTAAPKAEAQLKTASTTETKSVTVESGSGGAAAADPPKTAAAPKVTTSPAPSATTSPAPASPPSPTATGTAKPKP